MSPLEGLSKAILSNPLDEEMETQSYDSSLISEVCSILVAEEQGYALPRVLWFSEFSFVFPTEHKLQLF